VRAAPIIGFCALAALFASSAIAAVPVRLPPGESLDAWKPAFKMADLESVQVGEESPVLIEDRGDTWVLWARDDRGIVREVEVVTPTTGPDREDVAWLILSLLDSSPTIDLGLPPRAERFEPALPAPEGEAPDAEIEAPVDQPAVEAHPPSIHLVDAPLARPVTVHFELADGFVPFRGPVLPFASATGYTDVRFKALPAPSFELAAGIDIVGRFRAGIAVGATMLTPVAFVPDSGRSTQAASADLLGFGDVALDLRGRMRLGVALGARYLYYIPVSPTAVHSGDGEWVPTVRVEAGYAFRIGRSVAMQPTLGLQFDLLRDPATASRPAEIVPVTLRIGVRLVALRDVSFRLAPLPRPPPLPGGRKKE
jgi:hypothetical protein